jgi:hypothetical protein
VDEGGLVVGEVAPEGVAETGGVEGAGVEDGFEPAVEVVGVDAVGVAEADEAAGVGDPAAFGDVGEDAAPFRDGPAAEDGDTGGEADLAGHPEIGFEGFQLAGVDAVGGADENAGGVPLVGEVGVE